MKSEKERILQTKNVLFWKIVVNRALLTVLLLLVLWSFFGQLLETKRIDALSVRVDYAGSILDGVFWQCIEWEEVNSTGNMSCIVFNSQKGLYKCDEPPKTARFCNKAILSKDFTEKGEYYGGQD